jgi:hypothetical protein
MAHRLLIFATIMLLSGCSSSPDSATTTAAAPDEKAAIAALGQINRAQKDFFRRSRRYALTYEDLIAEKLLAAQPTAPGYDIQMKPSPDASRYTITAAPQASPTARYLFMDETGVVRGEPGKTATAASPPV